jgi:hypothetical protein
MTIPLEELCDGLEVDLCLARLRAVAAAQRLRREDTAANRAAAARCQAQLDVILDLLVELRRTAPADPGVGLGVAGWR